MRARWGWLFFMQPRGLSFEIMRLTRACEIAILVGTAYYPFGGLRGTYVGAKLHACESTLLLSLRGSPSQSPELSPSP